MKLLKTLGVTLATILIANSAFALFTTGGPAYVNAGLVTGTCTVSGNQNLSGGATMTCSGLNASSFVKMYVGMRNDQFVIGENMLGVGLGSGNRWLYSTNSTNSITYTATAQYFDSLSNSTGNVGTTLTLGISAGSVVATGGAPADNGSTGDIRALFDVTGLSGFTITANARVGGNNSSPAFFDPTHTRSGTDADVARTDLAFYWNGCGNGVQQTGEQCDLGGGNGVATNCCTTSCTFTTGGTQCRAVAGVCDTAESCTGSSSACPTDTFLGTSFVCRAAVGSCDAAEVCPGNNANCPSDAKQPTSFVCRAAGGPCDVAESCDGSSNTCPGDSVQPSSFVCRGSAGVCDLAEQCDGSGKNCPTDSKSFAVCRPAAGVCDTAETCTGSSDNCPTDVFLPSSTVCRSAGGVCDAAENCTGSAASCPPDAKQPTSTVCRASAGPCDIAENCDNVNNACPTDVFKANTVVCRTGSGNPNGGSVCDPDELCTGSAAACPSDTILPNTTVCNPGSGNPNNGDITCDPDEFCPGTVGGPCPVDTFSNAATVCNAGTNGADSSRDHICDPQEMCPGVPDQPCPVDQISPSGTVCDIGSANPNGGDLTCDPDETCSGAADAPCPADFYFGSTTVCNAGTNSTDSTRDAVCDPEEYCPNTPGGACPADVVNNASTVCDIGSGDPNGTGFVCDPDQHCSGIADTPCEGDLIYGAGTVCNQGTNGPDASRDAICDPRELCDGFAGSPCPPDFRQPAGTICDYGSSNPNGGSICDPDEVCSGNPDQKCPNDTVLPATTICRGDAGECDVPDFCTGSANSPCPPDAFEPVNTACGTNLDNDCTNPDSCDGLGTCLDNHEPVGTHCYGPGTGSNGFDPLGNTCKHSCDVNGLCQDDPNITESSLGAGDGHCCGNGVTESGELCDDGNQYAGTPPSPDNSAEYCPSDPSFNCTFSAGNSSLFVRGSRLNPARDTKGCQLEFIVVNPNTAMDKFGLPNYFQFCEDQDPTCDYDPTPGRCGIITLACLNVDDANLPNCTTAGNNGISSLGVLPLKTALSGIPAIDQQYQANTAALTTAVTHLFDPDNPGAGFGNQAPLAASQTNLCSEPKTLTIFAASNKPNESARARYTVRMKTKDGHTPRGRTKRSLLRLTCSARPLP